MPLASALHPRISQSTGAIRYWDPANTTGTASDANNGQTRTTAWRTQTYTIANVPLGGRVIIIGDGVTVTPPAGDSLVGFRWNRTGGSSSLVTTFEAETWRGVRFSTGFAPGQTTYGYSCALEQPGVRFKGIKIGGRGYLTSSGEGSPGLWVFKYAKEFEFYDCEFSDIGGIGLYMVGGISYGAFISDFWFYRCLFHDIGLDTHIGATDHTDGYYANKGTHMIYGPDNQGASNDVAEGGHSGVIASCIFKGNMPGRHLQMGAAAQDIQVVNCTSYGNTGLPMNGATSSPYAGSFIEWYNDSDTGVYRTNNNTVKNCIAALSKGSLAFGSGGGMSGNFVDNNLAYGMQNTGAATGSGWSASEDYPNEYVHGSGNLLYTRGTPIASANPHFVDAANGDFRLQTSSPAIGVGDVAWTPLEDYNGASFDPTTPSIGALEGGVDQPPVIFGQMPRSTLWPGDISNRTLGQMPFNTAYAAGTIGTTPANASWPPAGAVTPATVRSVSSATCVSSTTLNIAKPTGLADGDVLIACLNTRTETLTAPSGWTLISPTPDKEVRTPTNSAAWSAVRVYQKIITSAGGEPATYTWTSGTGSTKIAGGIVCVQGANTTTPVISIVSATNGSTSQQTFTTPSINLLTDSNACLICCVGQYHNTTFAPAPSGLTERVDTAAGSNATDSVTVCIATQDDIPSGPTGTKVFTDEAVSGWGIMAGHAIAIRRA